MPRYLELRRPLYAGPPALMRLPQPVPQRLCISVVECNSPGVFAELHQGDTVEPGLGKGGFESEGPASRAVEKVTKVRACPSVHVRHGRQNTFDRGDVPSRACAQVNSATAAYAVDMPIRLSAGAKPSEIASLQGGLKCRVHSEVYTRTLRMLATDWIPTARAKASARPCEEAAVPRRESRDWPKGGLRCSPPAEGSFSAPPP